ncbi:hypothetical protein ACLIBH_06145 [Virgibacillus sp. W0430]|uniref:hypothetical protein n=1 Tax=Virgibacillus sp. W0430 TaxID=3391580 RepID=UPI003F472EB9
MQVKMNVQTMYHGDLLRKDKIYEIEEDVAKRWIASKIAEIVNKDAHAEELKDN